jgi:alpha-tubulin suppressor-like RCC1 family protein
MGGRAAPSLFAAIAALGCAAGDGPRPEPPPLVGPTPAAPPRGEQATAAPPSAIGPTSGPPRIAGLACGDFSTCVRLDDGTARCWGTIYLPRYGDAVDPAQGHSSVPVPVTGLRGAAALALGTGYACALLGGQGDVACWGNNGSGQLGDGTTQVRYAPAPVPGLEGAVALALAPDHACALGKDGTVTCWGSNFHGAVGRGPTRSTVPAARVPGLRGAVAVGAGHGHSCAALDDGTVRCWGANTHGELGDGTTVDRLAPTSALGLTGAVELALGGATEVPVEQRLRSPHTCARLRDGGVSCWGDNHLGQLGDGTTAERHAPAPVPGLHDVVGIAAGTGYTCALLGDGRVSCWGDNREGQLGDGTTVGRLRPTPVPGLGGVVEIAARGFHTCARTGEGRVLCWGANGHGELGDGGEELRRATPAPVPGVDRL